jgi:hypothetical protein
MFTPPQADGVFKKHNKLFSIKTQRSGQAPNGPVMQYITVVFG